VAGLKDSLINNPLYTVSGSLGTIYLFSLAIPLLLETVANRLNDYDDGIEEEDSEYDE
jgi:hypothetical protein